MTVLTVLPLLQTLRDYADDPDLLHLHDPNATERQWTELVSTDDFQLWLISWPPGSRTGWHDHGDASGAFTTISGELTEHSVIEHGLGKSGQEVRRLGIGEAWAFSANHVHDVVNLGDRPALSVHAYSPRLAAMTRYVLVDGRLEATGVEGREQW
ncbi:cysteine dioxygenase [Nocardioides sp. Soil796]|uniref:cysteine dioxygenase n=1 Tax=Nocardioides sp. Soil796 TaxID=1736412 RepID=UPI00070F00E3|nr:cysteine dioxygenase family protein [Nocardioides sp. Soil796]KRF12703.1 hypothetical protein ASH02_14260 [Nocardioides sp. Soil796]